MYYSGKVSDYRFRYDVAAPSLLSLVKALAWGDPEKGNTEQISGRKRGRDEEERSLKNMEPLLPVACSVATLPMRARGHASIAVRHLMTDALSSPIAHVFAVCPTCLDLSQQLQRANQLLREARATAAMPVDLGGHDKQENLLEKKDSAAPELEEEATERDEHRSVPSGNANNSSADEPPPHDGDSTLEPMRAAYADCLALENNALEELTALNQIYLQHTREAHPHSAFPIADIEAAVATVPVENYPPEHRALTAFGRPLQIRFSRHVAERHGPGTSRDWWAATADFLRQHTSLSRGKFLNAPPRGIVCEPLGDGAGFRGQISRPGAWRGMQRLPAILMPRLQGRSVATRAVMSRSLLLGFRFV